MNDDRDDGRCAPIRVADDEGEILDGTDLPPGAEVSRSADGSITSVVTPEGGWRIVVDPATDFGARIHRLARERGETPEACVRAAIREFLDGTRADGTGDRGGNGPTVECPNGHTFDRDEAASATFDGDEARYQCPECGAWADGPSPG